MPVFDVTYQHPSDGGGLLVLQSRLRVNAPSAEAAEAHVRALYRFDRQWWVDRYEEMGVSEEEARVLIATAEEAHGSLDIESIEKVKD